MEPVLQEARPDVVLVSRRHIDEPRRPHWLRSIKRIAVGPRRSRAPDERPLDALSRRDESTVDRHDRVRIISRRRGLSREHLLREHVDAADIAVTGNTVIDAFHETSRRPDLTRTPRSWNELDPARPIVVVTAHRRENHEHMREMCLAMGEIASSSHGAQIYWPVHPSPRVAPVAHEVLDGVPGVVLVDPIEYGQMVFAVRDCTFVLTDSGGIQEEAPCLGKPVLVMRDETERPEGIDAGTLELVGHDRKRIVDASMRLLNEPEHFRAHGASRQPVWGRTGSRAHRRVAACSPPGRTLPPAVRSGIGGRRTGMKEVAPVLSAGGTFAIAALAGSGPWRLDWCQDGSGMVGVLLDLMGGLAIGSYGAIRLLQRSL